jgi:nucleoside-diphosphate-sugar epimerase
MKVFLTGATGYIGGAIAVSLLRSGHEVLGLVRSEEKALWLRSVGGEPLLGSMDDDVVVANGVARTDGAINAASADHFLGVNLLINALAGTGKPLVHTSGSSIVCDDAQGNFAGTAIFSDDTPFTPLAHRAGRAEIDRIVRAAGIYRGIRTAVVCPTMTYGDGVAPGTLSDQIPKLVEQSKKRGIGVHVGKGLNIWSNVYLHDLADLFVLALEHAPSGSFFFAENGEDSLIDVAASISHLLGFGGSTATWDLAEATAELGMWPRVALATNARVRATNAKELLRWRPTGPSLRQALLAERGK